MDVPQTLYISQSHQFHRRQPVATAERRCTLCRAFTLVNTIARTKRKVLVQELHGINLAMRWNCVRCAIMSNEITALERTVSRIWGDVKRRCLYHLAFRHYHNITKVAAICPHFLMHLSNSKKVFCMNRIPSCLLVFFQVSHHTR